VTGRGVTCDGEGVPCVDKEPWDEEAGVVGGLVIAGEDGVLCSA